MAQTAALYTRMAIPDSALTTLMAVRQTQPDLAHFIETGFTYSEVPANTCLVRAGEVPDVCYFVLSGLVRAYSENPSTQVTTHFMPEGFVVTSVHACLGRHATEESIETLEDCVIAEWHTGDFLPQNPGREFSAETLLLMNRYFTQLEYRVRILECLTGPEKLHCFNTLYPGLLRRAPLASIASYLNVTVKWLKKNIEAM